MINESITQAGWGGILGDGMGLGKSCVVLAVSVLQLLINRVKLKVTQDHQAHSFILHLSKEDSRFENAKCPSDPFPFTCPCVCSSAINKIHYQLESVMLMISLKLAVN